MRLLEPAAARLTMKARAIRADAATTSADQSVPLAYTLERAEAIMEKSIPNAIEPLLPAPRRAHERSARWTAPSRRGLAAVSAAIGPSRRRFGSRCGGGGPKDRAGLVASSTTPRRRSRRSTA